MESIETTSPSYQLGYINGYKAAVNIICGFLDEDLRNTTDRDGKPSIESTTCWTKEELINDIKKVML